MGRLKLPALNLDSSDKYHYVIEMIHSSYKEEDFSKEDKFDWIGEDDYYWIMPDFYKSDELERDGFIHQDGSLRFEFEIIRQNYRT